MEDDDSETSMTIDETAHLERPASSPTTTLQSDSVCKHNASKSVENKDDTSSVECKSNLKSLSCGDIAEIPSEKESGKNGNIVTSDSYVPTSLKKVNGEVKLPEDDQELDISASTLGSDRIRSSQGEEEDKGINSDNTKSKYKSNSVFTSEVIDVKNDCQNFENSTEYKGFKKKIIAQTSVAANNISDNLSPTESTPLNSSKSVKSKKASAQGTISSESRTVLFSHQALPDGAQSSAQLTEYAQYLGLQPTVKFKCYKCGESGFPSMLKLQEHQIVCFKNLTKMQSILKPVTTPTSSLSEQVQAPSTNFRITRKVYLCSACGTYYENWNLFLHMKEVHKRHICLFCLGMFSQADKLASHLSAKHGVLEGAYTSSDDFIGENKGSCFLMCCTCERIFTERDNFYEHSCSEGLIINAEKACSLCGLRGAHFPTCRRAFTDSSSTSPPPSNLAVPAPVESPAEPISNSQLGDRPASGTKYNTKYLVPVRREKKSNSGSTVHENEAESREKSKDLSDVDDDYDISNAAEYCHVNIDEPQEKQKGASLNKLKTYKAKNKETTKKDDAEPKESTPNEKKKEDENAEKTVDASNDIKDKEEKDKSVNTETSAVEKECEEKDKDKVTETSVSPAIVDNMLICLENKPEDGEQVQKETEPENADDNLEVSVDLDIPSKPRPNSEDETNEDRPTELHEENNSMLESEEKDNSETKEEPETKEKLPTELVASPETSPQNEIKQVLKTSATEAESESESSDSGEESDSSSSSDASSEESDHHEDSRNEMKIESGGDNEDSDKMSLIVDENRSEEGDEPDVEKSDESDKQNKELKEGEVKNIKEEEQESDVEMADNMIDDNEENKSLDEERPEEIGESIQLAGDEVPLLELTLEENLDTMNIQMLLKESVKVSCLNCVYCNHAKKIAVNGKQLALHLLAEHRFAPVVCSDSGELTEVDGFADKLKSSLSELQQMFFNTDSYDNMDENCIHPYDRTYECFHCHFVTTLHKELYLHNRKMHQKTILLCIMCKSNFYSYSELLCHLCPGIYVPESNITFRCCLCTVDGLPSAFRLMVHLRKRHHACDVCLETTGDQQKLSNHVWKHKLHHLCYRCGIAYRNKPDITKHLFWKHGTESVLCKKCLQKKWPHVYHFCIPPNAFICEECNSSFTRAVALKVHKRLHAGDLPYSCEDCEEKFISRKLLMKHQEKHREPSYEAPPETSLQENGPVEESDSHDENEDKLKLNNVSTQETDRINQEHPTCENTNLKKEIKEEEHVNEPASADCLSKAVEEESAMETSVDESCNDPPKMEDKDANEKKSKVLDVYDLPPLNLSSDSDDSDEDSEPKTSAKTKMEKKQTESTSEEVTESTNDKKISDIVSQQEDETQPPVPIIDGIWENFKNYKANLEKRESQQTESGQSPVAGTSSLKQRESEDRLFDSNAAIVSVIHMDHDYCGPAVGTSQSTHLEQSEGPQLEGETSQSLLPLTDTGTTDEAKEKSDEEMKACDADHNYCYTNTCSLSVEDEKEKEQAAESVSATISPSKKKQKSPKKKQKRSASSSSSDSSSSDSSTCSCGTNCSCSSSSSSSSGSSSSQSSDSDSSSSEGRRRQAARRERRKERAKKRKAEEVEEPAPDPSKVEVPEIAENGPPEQEDAVAASNPNVAEPEEAEMAVRESDLDTDETETDEDFYDKYPQKLANKLLAEKRNQLLLLAAVAPVNNGTMSQSCPSPPPSSVEEPVPKKKAKTKRHKRSHQQSHTSIGNKIKLNIPTNYYAAQNPVFSKSLPTSSSTVDPSLVATPVRGVQSPFLTNHPEPSTPTAAYQSTGSGSETDSKRLSKRKRVPKRFYGDSSDEEQEQQPPSKWRKVSTTASNSPVPTAQPAPTFTYKATPILETVREPSPPSHVNEDKSEDEVADDSDSEHDDIKKSSSDSSNSESEVDKEPDGDDGSDVDTDVETPSTVQTNVLLSAREGDSSVQQKNENLYCYCQCPYDEVSEMIACDGKDCTIEWFHFECVGIMVPPKGKWFCPDCRKRAAARSEYLLNV